MIRLDEIGVAATILTRCADGGFAIERMNVSAESLTGLVANDVVGRPFRDIFGDDTAALLERGYAECLAGRVAIDVERTVDLPRGQISTRTTLTPIFDAADVEPTRLLAITVDATEQHRMAEDLKRANARLSLAMEALGGGHWYFDVETGSFELSLAFEHILGPNTPPTMSLPEWHGHVHPDDRNDTCFADILSGRREQGTNDFRVFSENCDLRWVRCRRRAVVEHGQVVGIAGFVVDITQEKRRETELSKQAATDSLTGLANRRKLDEMLVREHARAAERGQPLSLLMIDVDHFKPYNDTYGHVAGDNVLRRIGRCLAQVAEAHRGMAARYGGEEFAVVLPGRDPAVAARVADGILDCIRDLQEPHCRSASGTVSVSIGVGGHPRVTRGTQLDLVALADAALYRAKADGRACYRVMVAPHLHAVEASAVGGMSAAVPVPPIGTSSCLRAGVGT